MGVQITPAAIRKTLKTLLRSAIKNKYDSVGIVAAIVATTLLFLIINSQDLQLVSPDDLSAPHMSVEADELRGPFLVERVVDGDTIIIDIDGKSERVRLIGVDTPEVASRFTTEECFGAEASAFTAAALEQAYVYTMSDTTQADRDRFDRLLRYIFIDQDNNFNLRLIEEGFAYEYTYRSNAYRYQAEFRAAQSFAQTAQTGLWATNACRGVNDAVGRSIITDNHLTQKIPDGCYHIADAADYVDASACLAGSVDHVFSSRTGHQFINFCPLYQNCPFSAVVFAEYQDAIDLSAINPGDNITMSGHVSMYRGQPQIIIRHQLQISPL